MSKAQSSNPQRARRLASMPVGLAILTLGLLDGALGATYPELYSIIVPREATGATQNRPRTQNETIRFAMSAAGVTMSHRSTINPDISETLVQKHLAEVYA